AMWRAIDAGYAYFDGGSRPRWRKARGHWHRMAARAGSTPQLVSALEGAIAELRDDHVMLVSPGKSTGRRIPYDLDIWPRWREGTVSIEAVRTFGDADVAGLHAGQVVTRVQNVPVESAVREMLGAGRSTIPDIEWALRRVLAGPRIGLQRIDIREARRESVVEVERTAPAPSTSPPILARRMGDERDIGYIRVRIGAANGDLAPHFAGALGHMTGTRALILDLRESAGPGSREATRSILSRFATQPTPWQVRQAPGNPRATDTVEPDGATYTAPLVVLVDRWTAGEGEALATGLVAVAKARVVGTAMAGLRGELHEITLPVSGIVVRYPGERTFVAASGAPREAFQPSLPVDLSAPSGGPGDPILYRALKLLERR
ncbi:MAG: hypothetical protein H7Y14_09175, partial [Burkholderiales bacterium]|nr:hypothetical protein [Burkholderiales bacterium]